MTLDPITYPIESYKTLPELTLLGYTFWGWYDETLTTKYEGYALFESATLYGKWKKEYKVTLMLDGKVYNQVYAPNLTVINYLYSNSNPYSERFFLEPYLDENFTQPLKESSTIYEDLTQNVTLYYKRQPVFDVVFHNDYQKLPALTNVSNLSEAISYKYDGNNVYHNNQILVGYYLDKAFELEVDGDNYLDYIHNGKLDVYIKWSTVRILDG